MSNEWKPNAPNLNDAFASRVHKRKQEKANVEQSKSYSGQEAKEQDGTKHQEVVTKKMQDQLEKQREKAQPSIAPQPEGMQNLEHAQKEADKREERIQQIRERLESAQKRMRGGFGKNR